MGDIRMPLTTDEVTREKQRLIFALEGERRKTLALLRDINPRLMVNQESEWRVMDVLGHLAAWERDVLASLQAFQEGDNYHIEDYEPDRYKREQYKRRRTLDPAQIRMDWGMVRRDVQDVIHDLHDHCFAQNMTYPSGDTGMVIPLIEELAAHEAEHRAEIAAAVLAASNASEAQG